MPATARHIDDDAATFDAFIAHDRNVSATARYEFLSRSAVRARVRRHETRLRRMANDIALDYAMFEADTRERHGADAKCTPLDSEYAFGYMRRRHGREHAIAMSSDTLVRSAVAGLPYARRIIAEADAS